MKYFIYIFCVPSKEFVLFVVIFPPFLCNRHWSDQCSEAHGLLGWNYKRNKERKKEKTPKLMQQVLSFKEVIITQITVCHLTVSEVTPAKGLLQGTYGCPQNQF